MASDLSKLIKEGLCSTLNGLLAKDAVLKETNKVVQKDFNNLEVLKVESTFEFKDITSTWSFIVPAFTASYIFNIMVGDDSEPAQAIDDDIADATNEVISNVSGGLTTTINGAAFEDLGNSKFVIAGSEIIEQNILDDFENIFKFTIDLDGTDIVIFILFDKVILPHIDEIQQSLPSVYEEEVIEEPEIEEEIEEPEVENVEDEAEDKEEIENIQTDEIENDDSEDEQEETSEEDLKARKLKKIIIIIAGLLVTTIVTGIAMYFLGMFEPEPIPIVDQNATKTVKTKDNLTIVKYNTAKKVDFKMSYINVPRLNKRLDMLTKYQILDNYELEEQILAERDRLYRLEREKELLKFAAKNKEEALSPKDEPLEDMTEEISADEVQTKVDSEKLKFVLVHSLKYKLYKKLILQTKTKNGRISICKNDQGRTAVYIGPFEKSENQKNMLKLIKEQSNLDASLENVTLDEFDSRCKFE